MMEITSNKIGPGPLLTGGTAPDATATGLAGDLVSRRGPAGAGVRDGSRQCLEAVVARGKHVVSATVRGLSDGLVRRRTIREMRIMGWSRLSDLGIEADAIEHVVDAMLAARRSRAGGAERMDKHES